MNQNKNMDQNKNLDLNKNLDKNTGQQEKDINSNLVQGQQFNKDLPSRDQNLGQDKQPGFNKDIRK
jgi:hypothetical protein